MHVRITVVPPRRAIDGLDLSGLQVGSTYLLATRLATYLVDGGFAESTEPLAGRVTACGAPMKDAVSGDARTDGEGERRTSAASAYVSILDANKRTIVSVEITKGPGPLPYGVFEPAPRVIATLENGQIVELFSYYANERSFVASEFVGLTLAQGRRLKFTKPRPQLTSG
jgi:hypothetical protein